jgi:uncharacterized protein YjbJ (UPF0337 family)
VVQRDSANGPHGQQAGTVVCHTLQGMWADRDIKARQRDVFRAVAARVERLRRRAAAQTRSTANAPGAAADDDLTTEGRISKVRSARQDRIRGRIDKIAGRVLEAIGRLTHNRSTVMKGKAARGRGTGRTAKARLKQRIAR